MKSILQNKAYLYLTCLFLGIITSFSLPPYNLFFINFLTLPVLLYILVNYVNKKTISFFVGWVFGFGYFISNLYWITNSLTFDVNFKLIIPFALILIPLFLGIFYGLVTFLCNFFNLKNKISSILIFSIFFGGIEFLRSFIFGGFPWNLVVFSLSNNLHSLQILSYIGTYSLNLLSITIFLLPVIFFFKYKKILYGKKGFNDYSVEEPGFKYNLTDIQASIGIHQLKRISENSTCYVNLKYIRGSEWIFFTNYDSPKSNEFMEHNQICATFHWDAINTQIRIKAKISKTSKDFSDNHYANRSIEKNILAHSSNQSEIISSYKMVKDKYELTKLKKDIIKHRPKNWGGFSFIPYYFEFWEGHEKRINTREVYNLKNNVWDKYCLQP